MSDFMDALNNVSRELKQEARVRRKKMKEIKTMAAKKRLPKMETWERKMFVKGAPCEKGETSEKTGCTPRKGETKGEAGKESPKKAVVKKAGTTDPKKIESGEEEKGEKKRDAIGEIAEITREKKEAKKRKAAEKKIKKMIKEAEYEKNPPLETRKDVEKWLKKGPTKEEVEGKKKEGDSALKVAGKKLGKIFIPKGGGKKIKWNGKVWTDGDQILAGTRSSGPMHGKTGRRVERATK